MSDRRVQLARFLSGTRWRDWRTEPIPGDASARAYVRLRGPRGSVIAMDADPAVVTDTPAFLRIARWLEDEGLVAPRLLEQDAEAGFLVLSDLGETNLADALSADVLAMDRLIDAATDVLAALDVATPPPGLAPMTPKVAGDMVAITAELCGGTDPAALSATVEEAFDGMVPDRVALRDVHAENLIWRPWARGLERIGLLDFQDAFLAPRGYDLASILSDARRALPTAQRERQIARFAEATGAPAEQIARDVALLAAQRNLRILGVFTRLIAAGKPRYAVLMPRVRAMLARDLGHPDLRPLARAVRHTLPDLSL